MKEEDSDPRSVQSQLTAIIVKHTPRAKPNAKAFWNRELELERKELMKEWRSNPLDPGLTAKKKTFRKHIAEAKMESNARCLQEETDPECFRSVKPRATKHPIPALERSDGTMAAEHQHIAEELHSALYQGESRRHPRRMEPPKETLNTGNLDAALKNSPNGAATGPDHIPTRMIREFRRLREKLFMATMNQAWTQGIPPSWKSSSTILIPKLNKPAYTIAKSWRPIQLQSILAKVLERAVVDRIARLDILPDNMYGGRKRFGTTDAIQKLNDIVMNNPKGHTCFTALDIEGGFDHLDLEKTCQTLSAKDKHMAGWIWNWGCDRHTGYKFNGRTSRTFATDRGTPQGSPLSPILFLISIIGLASILPRPDNNSRTNILTYVDDFLVATTYEDKAHGQEDHQDTIDRLSRGALDLGYRFAPSKAEHIFIRTPPSESFEPKLDGSVTKAQKTMRWLGYHITEDWKWDSHVKLWIAKANESARRLRALTERYKTGGLNAWTTWRLINGLIIPQLTFGIETWGKKGLIKEAQTTLNQIVRRAFGLEKKTPTQAMWTELGIPPLDLYTKYRHNLLALRARTLDRPTNWSEMWLRKSGISTVINNTFGLEQGKKSLRENLLQEWTDKLDDTDIRYQGKPSKKHVHLRGITRHQMRDIIYLRATAGWPFQGFDGTRLQCQCGRDLVTPYHLMNTCADTQPTDIGLYDNRKIQELAKWVETWPPHMRRIPGSQRIPDPNYAQVAGAAVNLPTSQPQSTDDHGNRSAPCPICGKMIRVNKNRQEAHARTHGPRPRKGRIKGAGAGGSSGAVAGPEASGSNA